MKGIKDVSGEKKGVSGLRHGKVELLKVELGKGAVEAGSWREAGRWGGTTQFGMCWQCPFSLQMKMLSPQLGI